MSTRREFVMGTTAAGILAVAGPIAHSPRIAAADTERKRVASVQTVLGPIEAQHLGFTLTHEHVGSSSAKIFGSWANSIAIAVDKLKEARDAGISTVVDVTTFDTGRDVRFCEEISRKSGMQIVACTGQHLFADDSLGARTVEEISGLFIREIEQGIGDTDIKAGVIKVAARSAAMTAAEVNVFKAAARASKATGVPVETHTDARRRSGTAQVEIFEAEGLTAARVALGHSDDADDMGYLVGLARRGYTLGMDHIHRGNRADALMSWEERTERIKRLIDSGFVDRIFLSTDWVLGDAERERTNPDGLLFSTRKTIPYLQQIGVSQRDIEAITVENPKRFFTRYPMPQ
jgi:phosphotriesterase-related protein